MTDHNQVAYNHVPTPDSAECFTKVSQAVQSRLLRLSLQQHHCEPAEHAPPVSLDNLGVDAGLLENHLEIFRSLPERDRNPALAGKVLGNFETEAKQPRPVDQEIISEMIDDRSGGP